LLGAVVWGAVAGCIWIIEALMGFNGLAMFVGFVADFVQVFCVVIHVPLQIGCA
jgi:hypothetical protein